MMLIKVNVLSKVVLLTLLLTVTHANAARNNVEKFGAWNYLCQAVKTGKICSLRHMQFFKDKTPALMLGIANTTATDKIKMRFKVPLGVYLPDGFSVRVDTRKPRVANYQDCNKSGCMGAIDFNKDEIWALKKGNKMQVKYTYRKGKKTMTLDVPLDGTDAGIAKVWRPGKPAQKKATK